MSASGRHAPSIAPAASGTAGNGALACRHSPPCGAAATGVNPTAMHPSWADLKSSIRRSGRFDRPMILRIALARARAEDKAFARMRLPQPWPTLLAHELRLAWQVAKTAMDGLLAERMRARLDPSERAARTLELHADLATTAIPPDPPKAAALRAQAARMRDRRGAS